MDKSKITKDIVLYVRKLKSPQFNASFYRKLSDRFGYRPDSIRNILVRYGFVKPEDKNARVSACIEYMTSNPPVKNEPGYYKKVAKKFGYPVSDSVRNIAKKYKLKGIAIRETSQRLDIDPEQSVRALLTKRPRKSYTVIGLTKTLNISESKLSSVISKLRNEGLNIHSSYGNISVPATSFKIAPSVSMIKTYGVERFRVGVTADNHLASKYSRLDIVNRLFDIWEKEGVKDVYQAGNIIDGESGCNRFDVCAHGMDGQVKYLIDNWPKRDGITTKFITGDDHEGWYVRDTGVDIGRYIAMRASESGRKDLIYLGHMEHDVFINNDKNIIRIVHPGGGSSYAYSYTAQKIVDSYEDDERPSLLIIGHYHKSNFCHHRGVYTIEAGTTCDSTPFMRKKRLGSHLGGWTVDVFIDKTGRIHGISPTWHPFYDKDAYSGKQWSYKW